MTISNDSIVVAVKSQVSREVDAETVVLHVDKGLYLDTASYCPLIHEVLSKRLG
jgi:hypothetical protein